MDTSFGARHLESLA